MTGDWEQGHPKEAFEVRRKQESAANFARRVKAALKRPLSSAEVTTNASGELLYYTVPVSKDDYAVLCEFAGVPVWQSRSAT